MARRHEKPIIQGDYIPAAPDDRRGTIGGEALGKETVMSKRAISWITSGIVAVVLGAMLAGPIRVAWAEDHNPRIHHALDALRDARDEINNAHHDFHGEKRAALDAIQNAIDHLDRIKDYDN
jgi:hypothetical protein